MSTVSYRTIFLSDTHLGLRSANSEYLADFLRHTRCETLYLVGDIVDGWKLKSGWYWPAINNEIVHSVLDKARSGTRVIYVPGNHDEMFRDYTGVNLSGVEVMHDAIHVTANGRRLLVLHGDEFDCVVMHNRLLTHLGSWGYDLLLWLNHWLNVLRRRMGFRYWSLSSYVKNQVKEALRHVDSFQSAVVRSARERGLDGAVCGHIHQPTLTTIDGITYANCGDWVESCTALAEQADGTLKLIHWMEESFQILHSSDEAIVSTPTEKPYANSNTDGRVVTTGQRRSQNLENHD